MLHVYLSASAEIAAYCAAGERVLWTVMPPTLILAPDEQTLEQMVNLIESLFARLQELSRLYQTRLTRRLNLQSIVRQATDILDNPMLVADPNNEIVAMSEADWDDSAWQRFQEQRCLPYHPDMAQAYAGFVEQVGRGELVELVDGLHKKGLFHPGSGSGWTEPDRSAPCLFVEARVYGN